MEPKYIAFPSDYTPHSSSDQIIGSVKEYSSDWVVVSNIFYFHPYLGKIPILTHIFQMGWNHQLGTDVWSFR